ncbi:hypothetical protein ACH4Q7_22840 [Streptomyces roseolus]|uniref:hypothetical protein n=1 Tax=Streptomyces roseolus TaxID=67358 RepID=UPI00378ADA53
MKNMLHVQPATELRVPFARWAVAQTPKLRTVGPTVFAVPADLYADMPEDLLIGARVNGHRYVSPKEDAADGTPPPGAELLGVATREGLTSLTEVVVGEAGLEPHISLDMAEQNAATAERESVLGESLAEVSVQDHTLGSASLPTPDNDGPRPDAPLAETDQGAEPAETTVPFTCGRCPREFTTERGRDTHRRQAHPED